MLRVANVFLVFFHFFINIAWLCLTWISLRFEEDDQY